MKSTQFLNETTTAGSVASVSMPFKSTQKRTTEDENVSTTNKKSKKKYANSLTEGKIKDLYMDLKLPPNGLSDEDFFKKYNKTKKQMRILFQNKQEQIKEQKLEEEDLIIVPGQGRKLKTGFIPHGKSRLDHEVEMARSDLFQAHKNAKKIYNLIKDKDESEGLEGWVQEKIIKANDYLNTVREYLEHKTLTKEGMKGAMLGGVAGAAITKTPQGALTGANIGSEIEDMFKEETGGVIAGGGVGEGVAEGLGKNVVKSVKVGNFRHDLVDTGMGWQVRIYNGDELYDTGMSKNSEQKGLAALEDAVAYTEKQTRTKRQGVAEGVAEGWKEKAASAALAGSLSLGSPAATADIGASVAKGLGRGAVAGVVGPQIYKEKNAADLAFAEKIPDETDKAEYLKAFERIKKIRTLSIIRPAGIGLNAVHERRFEKLKQNLEKKYNIQMPANEGVAEGYSLKKTGVSKYMEPGDPDEYTQDVNIKDTDYEIINNKTGQVVGTASWTTNDFFGPGALKITMKNGATRWLDIWEREKGNPQTAFNRFVKDPKTAKKYKEQGVAEDNLKEIGYADELGNLEMTDADIIRKSERDDTIGKRDVLRYSQGNNTIYFFATDNKIDALILLDGDRLAAIKNFTINKGLISGLFNYLINIKQKKLRINSEDQLTPYGLDWLLKQISRKNGFKITDLSGNPINADDLKREWRKSKSDPDKNPGSTGVIIGESVMGKILRKNEQSLMPYDIFGVNKKLKTGVAEGFPHDVDHMLGKTIKHTNTNCTTCHGRKLMYKLDGKLFADNKPESIKVKCPTCKGTGDKQDVSESTKVTDYNVPNQGGTRKELLAKYHKTKNPKDAQAARKAGATQKELQGDKKESNSINEMSNDLSKEFADFMKSTGRKYTTGRPPERPQPIEPDLTDEIAKLPMLKQQYQDMVDQYNKRNGDSWIYADREQNLSPFEKENREMWYGPITKLWRKIQELEKAKNEQNLEEDSTNEKTFRVTYYSKKLDKNVTKKMKAENESDIWNKFMLKNIDVVSIEQLEDAK